MPDLTGALDALGASLESDEPYERELHLMLPSFEEGPQCSPQLLRGVQERRPGSPELLDPWVVPSVGLGPMAALDLLLGLPAAGSAGDSQPRAGIAIGDSLRFLAEAGKLALELVARGRLLPGLARREQEWVSWWRAMPGDPEDMERVGMLVAAMPPLARAEISFSEQSNAAQALVGDLLEAVVDACARSFLASGLTGRQMRRRSKRQHSVVDAWVAALTDPDPVIDGNERELAVLAEELDEWRQAGERYAEHRMFRTCFRLCEPDEPAEPADPWRVEFLLQAKDDPSVLVPAEEVWSSNGSGLKALGHRLADPQERLLGGLGHALRLWPALEPALREAAPTNVDLMPQDAIAFVRDAAPALEQAGFGVLAPPWWNKRLRLTLKVEPFDEIEEGSGLFGLDGLCAYQWRIAVGDATLSLAELRELAALKLPLVMARGRWIVLRPDDVEAALAFFERRAERGQAPAGELIREGLSAGAEARADLPPVEIEGGGWLKELLSTNGDRKLREVSTPTSFEGELRPYQQRGLAWLSFLSSLGLGACLADDMGLGKTVQLLALLLAEREYADRQSDGGQSDGSTQRTATRARSGAGRRRRKRLEPTLLVCPMTVAGNWEREAQRFAPGLRVHVHHGPERLADKRFVRAARASDLVITTYALATRDRDTLAAVKWERIALDEAQNIKTIETKQTRAIRSLPARHRVALTGTPVENRLTSSTRSWIFSIPACLARPRRSSAATQRRSSAIATSTPRRVYVRRPARSFCAA